ncbi:MAG: DNRLRE domain-containing protein, partial [Bacteroidota bacterium]
MKQHYLFFFFRLLLLTVIATPLAYSQTTVTLDVTKDNSIYSENNNSNGSGSNLFTGRTNNAALRRALVQFDLDGIPSDATITAVRLRLVGNRQGTNSVTAHRLNADWGEGTSDAAGQEGRGASPSSNDATWNFNFFNSESWSAGGGDFESTASADDGVSSGSESIWEGSGMIADVQDWVDGSAENFGWILIGDEGQNNSAVRLASKENSSAANRPTLEVTFEVACDADGGTIAIADGGGDEIDICAGDGESDAFTVDLSDASGSNSTWVITDADANILMLSSSNTFDLEGAGPGVCLVWHLSFEDDLTGAEVGNNASQLGGCFDLSNPITVNRTGVDGGVIELATGGTELTICAGDGVADPFTVNLDSAMGTNSAWVITDDQANILAIADTNVFDLDPAGGGVCLVWHLSFEDGLTGAEVGSNAADLEGCYDLSNPITVTRNGVDGGTISIAGSAAESIDICAGDGVSDAFTVELTGDEGTNSIWVITDDQANILALADTNVFDLEGAGPGVCLVWHLSFEDDLMGAMIGNNAGDLSGCFDLSNPITVNRTGVDGGEIALEDGTTELTICAGDGMSDAFTAVLTGAEGANSAWVITDGDANILAIADTNVFDFDGAGPGVCLVWHLSFADGLTGAEVGNNAADLMGCFDLSNPISVTRNQPDGGVITIADGGGDVIDICAGDGMSDAFTVDLDSAMGTNSAWVITDADANILAIADTNVFDLEGAGPGVCLVWHLSFEDGLMGAAVGNNAADLMGCFDLSNPITVNRTGVNGGEIALEDGTTELTICAGDGTPDPFTVSLTGAEGANSAWVITDADANILAIADTNVFDLDGAGPGVCLVWHLSFADGLTGAEVGNNAADLMGCFDLSNPITVNRNGVDGGMISIANDGGDMIDICAGDGVSDAFTADLTGNIGTNSIWVITDANANILALADTNVFDLDGAGPGVCLVWHLS